MRMINNALSGALAAQAGLHATSQNLSNLLTPGYSRQGVLLAASVPRSAQAGDAGNGVTVVSMRRYNDEYKSLQMWQANTRLGYHEGRQPFFRQLEQVAGSEGTSLSVGLDQFYASLNVASAEPGSIPLRQQVIESAQALAHRANNLMGVTDAQMSALREQRGAIVGQINTLTGTLARLNDEIAAGEAAGLNTAGLMDERDRQIDALAGMLDVRVVNQPDGSKTVTLPDGQPLVVGNTASVLEAKDNADGSQTLTFTFGKLKFPLASDRVGGRLGGLNEYETQVLRPMQDGVRTLMQTLADDVNAQLGKGFDLNGKAGAPLFVFDAGKGRLEIAKIKADELAFSATGAPGDSGNLQVIIALKDKKIDLPGLGKVTLGDGYAQLLSRLATQSQQNDAGLETAKVVRAEAENNWSATSGVNQDEEAINLMEFQKMYQANMKVVAVANSLFDSTLAIF
ncbi:flagellar hook-associated protein FlgK [Crenobacter caeni]|uniref:Flagellar hook-associated protein 1 n=1 Tax=Crenobacter caeni TaxID=2705474 RepID=A0A6B2KRL0_9NEIS|nr:flagellar hook-associated protein FlgK [Crenobacter caeni]NDV12774.1 flagellar hook-associated protein FlgK [Crenobacter caeni]